MLRWLAAGIFIYILYKLVSNELQKKNKTPKSVRPGDKAGAAPGSDMVKDPTCGTYVEITSGISVRDGTMVHRFCSYECRDAFLEKLRGAGREIPEKENEYPE